MGIAPDQPQPGYHYSVFSVLQDFFRSVLTVSFRLFATRSSGDLL